MNGMIIKQMQETEINSNPDYLKEIEITKL